MECNGHVSRVDTLTDNSQGKNLTDDIKPQVSFLQIDTYLSTFPDLPLLYDFVFYYISNLSIFDFTN